MLFAISHWWIPPIVFGTIILLMFILCILAFLLFYLIIKIESHRKGMRYEE